MVTPSEVLNNLHEETLLDLYLHDHPEDRDEANKLKKKVMVSALASLIELAGVKTLLANLRREELKGVAESRGDILKEGDKLNSKALLSKRVTEAIASEGIDDFIQKGDLSQDILEAMVEALEEEQPSNADKANLQKAVISGVRRNGLDTYFSYFGVDVLHIVCEDLKLNTRGTNNKRKLVECIINREDAPRNKVSKKQKVIAPSKNKQPIEKGTTFDDIFQHYYVDEVREWCRQNGLKTNGKKAALIRRILAYFDGDTETTMASSSGSSSSSSSSRRGRKRKVVEPKNDKEANDDKKANGNSSSSKKAKSSGTTKQENKK